VTRLGAEWSEIDSRQERDFSSTPRQNHLWFQPVANPVGNGISSSKTKRSECEADQWLQPKCVVPYLHSHIRLYDVMLSQLRGKTFYPVMLISCPENEQGTFQLLTYTPQCIIKVHSEVWDLSYVMVVVYSQTGLLRISPPTQHEAHRVLEASVIRKKVSFLGGQYDRNITSFTLT
jgi:hypothetical protein